MDVIRMNIRMKLVEHGYPNLKLTTVLSPAWTTDWMTERGKEKLLAYGIAPPLSPSRYVIRRCSTGRRRSPVRNVILIILP